MEWFEEFSVELRNNLTIQYSGYNKNVVLNI